MIKILAACGAGVNSSHQIKNALEEELSNRGYDVHFFIYVLSSCLCYILKQSFWFCNLSQIFEMTRPSKEVH